MTITIRPGGHWCLILLVIYLGYKAELTHSMLQLIVLWRRGYG